jgi:predicted nucleic acid-binding protein
MATRRRARLVEPSLFQHVLDSSSLINFERRRQINELRKRRGEVVIPQKVAEEVKQPRSPLKRFFDAYPSLVIPFSQDEEELYLQVRFQQGIDDGEAAAIALAQSRRLPLVIDDKKGKSKAENHGITCLKSDQFLPP